jgi:hypothetical protein
MREIQTNDVLITGLLLQLDSYCFIFFYQHTVCQDKDDILHALSH